MTPLHSMPIILELRLSRFARFSIRSTSKPCALPSRINSKGLNVGELPQVSLPASTVFRSSASTGATTISRAAASAWRSMVVHFLLMHRESGGGLEIAVRWSFQSQMIAQRRARIVRTKQVTALQFRHDTVHEILEPLGHGVELHHEAVAGSGAKPVL